MKILNLFFKNINSLEGENRIDFEQPPFTDTGVFAITGANGSGKSSILDAITLALYGETFRFDKPAQHIITQHTDHSFSQIEFAIGADKYRSSWRVQRESTDALGKVLPSEMQLLHLNQNEEVLANTPQDVCSRMVEITGMNFRSFTRSILLAQGDFAAFLNALDNERMDILEKIINSDIYADYKKAAVNKLEDEQKKLTYLQQDLASVPLITPESLSACEHDLTDFSDQVAEFQEQINQFRQQQASFDQTKAIRTVIADKEAKLQEAITQRLDVQKKLDQLTEAETAMAFKNDLEDVARHKELVDRNIAELTALRNELKQIENALTLPAYDINIPAVQEKLTNETELAFGEQKQAVEGLRSQVGLVNANWQSEVVLQKSLADQIAEKQTELTGVNAWLDEHPHDRLLVENFPDFKKLISLRNSLKELADKKKVIEQWAQSTATTLQKNKNDVNKKTEGLEKLKQDLIDSENNLKKIAQGHSLANLEELSADQKERVNHYEELVNLANLNQKLLPQPSFFSRLLGKPQLPDRLAEELANELEALKEQLKTEENIRLSLERAVYNDALIARMAHDRSHLIDGKPCPLCGASEHPYAKHPPAPANAQQALVDQRIKIKRLNSNMGELTGQVNHAQKKAEKNITTNTQLQRVRGRWQTLCNTLNIVSDEMDINNIAKMKELLKSENIELKNIESLVSKYKATEKQIGKLNALIEKNTTDIAQLQININNLESESLNAPDQIQETENTNIQLKQEESELSGIISAQLTHLNHALPDPGKESVLETSLMQRRLDCQGYLERKQNLSKELELLTTKQQAGQTQIDTYKTRADEINTQLQVEEIVGLHLALVEKQKLIADKDHQVNQLIVDGENRDKEIAGRLEQTPFGSLSDVSRVLLLLDEHEGSAEQKSQLDINVAQWGVELDKLYQELITLQGDENASPPEEIELQIKSVQEKMELAAMEAERLETIIREQKLLQQKYHAISEKIEDQLTSVKTASTDVEALSAESGLALKRRVQTNLIEKLLSHTNAILEKINGRYYVRQQPTDRGLALAIEDTYQGNAQRLPKTLSGGESFIVSLALALGLSELASQGRSIDSLFLDEGFGNLDAETLYTVINTLEGLRAHGKTVGVISHVEAIQKRFKAQLQLIKKPNGLGELRKVS